MRQLNENYSNSNSVAVLGTASPSDMGQIFSYNGNSVRMRKMNGYILCLTDFAKPFPDKNLSHIVNSKELSDYVARMSEIQNCSSLDLLQVTKGNHSDGREQGTWAHHRVAIRVAQKLSTDFAIWVDDKIEELLTTGSASLQPQLPNFNNPAEAAFPKKIRFSFGSLRNCCTFAVLQLTINHASGIFYVLNRTILKYRQAISVYHRPMAMVGCSRLGYLSAFLFNNK